ncbi:MAG: hypothetical protein KatS3mg033_2033 [Thermonema sp.]|uniref:PP2C family protein-serine/threonine phosphatase n=1 Tax=Thermonema sp. TaxID=2231181 RepID=UPI0021DD3CFF|nr:SpoIIE family protein phosphatase [Thermonema sp.]GIV40233.1 MAG: hypothetical protein KatS3mg033_2033 [Thermonema sp.]
MTSIDQFLKIDLDKEWEKEYERLGALYNFWGAILAALFLPLALLVEMRLPKADADWWYLFRLAPSLLIGLLLVLYRLGYMRHDRMMQLTGMLLFTSGAYWVNPDEWLGYLIFNATLFLTIPLVPIMRPAYFVLNFVYTIVINITFFIVFNEKSFVEFWTQRIAALFLVGAIVSYTMGIARYYYFKNAFRHKLVLQKALLSLEEKNRQLEAFQAELREKNEELRQQNEEIMAQRDEIEEQKRLIEEQNQHILDSIHYAKRIQEAILPKREELDEALKEYFVLYKPRDIVSGDFYWLLETEDDLLWLAVVDCTGHGVPGALMSMLGYASLNNFVLRHPVTGPAAVLEHMSEEIPYLLRQAGSQSGDGMDVGIVCIDRRQNVLKVAAANSPILYVKNGELHKIEGSRRNVGGSNFRSIDEGFKEEVIHYRAGDCLYLLSDGYQDQFGGPKGRRKFGSRRLRELLQSVSHLPMPEQGKILEQQLENWMEEGQQKQLDDISLVGVRL